MGEKTKKYKFKNENAKRKNILGYSFLSPWIIGAVFLTFIPFIIAVIMSFSTVKHDVHGYHFTFNGLKNFVNALTQNVSFLTAIGDFMKTEIIYVPIILVISFILAIILNKNIKGRGFFRTIYFMPVIIMSGALITMLFESTTTGTTGNIIEGPEQTSFLFRIISSYSMPLANAVQSIFDEFVVILWLTGIPIVLFINALQKISKDLYAAAQIDGATSWQCLWKITIPNVRSTAMIIAVFSIVQVATLPTSQLYTIMNNMITTINQEGLAAAMAFIMTIFILLMIGLFALILLPRQKKVKEVITYTQNMGRKESEARNKKLRSVQASQRRQMKALRRAQLDHEEEVELRRKKLERENKKFKKQHDDVSKGGN